MSPRYAHTGAHPVRSAHRAPRLPRRVNPRLTARFMGIRTTRRTADLLTGIIGAIMFATMVFDFDSDPTSWRPILVQSLDAIMTWAVTR